MQDANVPTKALTSAIRKLILSICIEAGEFLMNQTHLSNRSGEMQVGPYPALKCLKYFQPPQITLV